MITRTSTITLDGQTKAEFEAIKAKLTEERMEQQGWKIVADPVLNRVTAIKTEQVTI